MAASRCYSLTAGCAAMLRWAVGSLIPDCWLNRAWERADGQPASAKRVRRSWLAASSPTVWGKTEALRHDLR